MSLAELVGSCPKLHALTLTLTRMFFFTMAWNGLSQGLVLSSSTSIRQHVLWRVIVSTGWSLVASLCTAGWSIAYMGPTYLLPVKNFFAFWSVTWVFCIFNMDCESEPELRKSSSSRPNGPDARFYPRSSL